MRELLWVDDNVTLLKVMGKSLSSSYKVTTFTLPREAINYIMANPDKLDVVVSDFKMPGLNGLDVLEKVAQVKNNTVRVLLTGFAEDVILENKSDICDAVIDKNICKNIQDIVALVDKITKEKKIAV